MKKSIALLLAIIFAATSPVMAAGVTLSDEEMDSISAGDWVVIGTDEEVVEGLHFSNNDIKLKHDSQRDIQAVSNANVVDSAAAVQTNISNVTNNEQAPLTNSVEGHNVANIANYNPSVEDKTWDNTWKSDSLQDTVHKATLETDSQWESKTFGAGFSYSESDVIDEDLVIAAALVSAGETEGKNNEGEFALAAAFALGYTFDETYSKEKSGSLNKTHSASKTWFSNSTEDKTTLDVSSTDNKSGTYKRKNLSENNHIDLEDQSQQAIQAVSNLNAVGSGVAIQTNLANNVGNGHSIVHTNTATIINGL